MTEGRGEHAGTEGRPPLGQRLYERPFLLLIAGFAIMALVYTVWWLWEIVTLPPAELP